MMKKEGKGPRVDVRASRKVFGKVPDERAFVLEEGRKLKSVFELVDALETMSEEVFRHHVSPERNDFANWLEGVFDEKVLAAEGRRLGRAFDVHRVLLKHLVREFASHHQGCGGC